MKKPLYSAKPGQILDEDGNPRSSYYGKPKSIIRNADKWDRDFSERRRMEIKREMGAKMLIESFKPEIKAQIRLNKKLKNGLEL